MKKSLMLMALAMVAAFVVTGCAGITTNNGGVAPAAMGPNFYSEVQANAIIPTGIVDAKVVKADVTAQGVLKSYFACVNLGDISYATLKAAALEQAPGANDLTNVKMDYKQEVIFGISTVTVTLTADAIKK